MQTRKTRKLSLKAKLLDLVFAGEAPLDKYSQAVAKRSNAEVAAVYVPIDKF